MDPKLSIVMTARNDDYGGNLLNRIRTSLRSVIHFTNKYNTPIELLMVEYNPLPDAGYLSQVLKLPDHPNLDLKFIRVPSNFHKKVAGESKNPFLEYVAKNIGIRRAKADYILCTNPDIIYSEEMLKRITGDLDPNTFYRANRHDLAVHGFDDLADMEEIFDIASKRVNRIWTYREPRYVSFKRWSQRFINKPKPRNLMLSPIFNVFKSVMPPKGSNVIHEAAAGDYLLTHRNNWEKISAYDQRPFNSYVDGYALYMLYCFDVKQEVLPEPIYHINHKIALGGRATIQDEYERIKREMMKTKKPYREKEPNWGFPNENFEEVVV